MNKKEFNEDYRNSYDRIKTLINKFDPCALIQNGAPDDEYDCLTNRLIGLANSNTTSERLKEIIISEMRNHFGVDTPTEEPYKSNFNRDLDTFAKNVRSLDQYNLKS